ncbi:MAG: Na/Pi symporter [Bacillota bacterium]|nr:Na/Pi symporter [Bacillota bacterium]
MAIIFWVAGGWALFYAGLRVIASALRQLAGERGRQFLARFTGTPLSSFLTGFLLTVALQSSSAVTVMLVGLAEAGLVDLKQVVGVVLGSNVGTSLAVQLFTLPPELILWPALLLSGLFSAWRGPGRRISASLSRLMGGGALLFLGLQILEQTFTFWGEGTRVTAWLERAGGSPWEQMAVGAAVTGLLQSSGLVIGTLIALVRSGAISGPAGVCLMLGSNVGTCVTALLAGLSAGTAVGRRSAWANLLVNVAAVALILPVLDPFTAFALSSSSDPGRALANAHFFFNLGTGLLLLPCTGQLARLLEVMLR